MLLGEYMCGEWLGVDSTMVVDCGALVVQTEVKLVGGVRKR